MEKNKRIIKKVLLNKNNQQLMLTVPSNCGISAGDYVEINALKIVSVKGKDYLINPRDDFFINENGLIELKKK